MNMMFHVMMHEPTIGMLHVFAVLCMGTPFAILASYSVVCARALGAFDIFPSVMHVPMRTDAGRACMRVVFADVVHVRALLKRKPLTVPAWHSRGKVWAIQSSRTDSTSVSVVAHAFDESCSGASGS